MAGLSLQEVLGRLLRIQGLSVQGAKLEPRGLVVQVRPRQRKPRCGVCGRPAPGYDTSPARLWRHLAVGETILWLHDTPRRVRCREQGVRVERVPWAAHDSFFTRPFEELMAWQAQRLDKSSICRLLGINWRTVGTLIECVVEERLSTSRLEGLQIIGVDELGWSAGQYRIAAYTDNAGRSGTLINEIFYTANRYGLQDVPLWVPTRYDRVWVRIAGQTSSLAEFGTSAEGTNPSPGLLLLSTNAGASWAPASRDMTFVTYQRR